MQAFRSAVGYMFRSRFAKAASVFVDFMMIKNAVSALFVGSRFLGNSGCFRFREFFGIRWDSILRNFPFVYLKTMVYFKCCVLIRKKEKLIMLRNVNLMFTIMYVCMDNI